MTTNELSGQERTDLEITVCTNGVVNVHNPESDRAHSIMLDGEGNAIRCSCKGSKFNDHCYHTSEVESRPLVVASATATGATTGKQVVTDGGCVETSSEDGETADNGKESSYDAGTVEVGGCAACDGFTTGGDKSCSETCRERSEVNDTPL